MSDGEKGQPQVDIQIASEAIFVPSEKTFLSWVTIATCEERLDSEVSIRIVDVLECQTLNMQYRGIDKPTNVLSFPAEFPEGVDIPFLGDIVICAPVVELEAKTQNKVLEDHWAHMLIHGVLHLLGYDHIADDEAEIMEALEVKYLALLGIASPY